MNIKATYTYKGEVRESFEDGGLIWNDEFAYFLDADTDNIDSSADPYFEINLYTKWNEEKQTYEILPSGYVNHFACTEDCKPDWSTSDVKIEIF